MKMYALMGSEYNPEYIPQHQQRVIAVSHNKDLLEKEKYAEQRTGIMFYSITEIRYLEE
jgi:hypothetical protein